MSPAWHRGEPWRCSICYVMKTGFPSAVRGVMADGNFMERPICGECLFDPAPISADMDPSGREQLSASSKAIQSASCSAAIRDARDWLLKSTTSPRTEGIGVSSGTDETGSQCAKDATAGRRDRSRLEALAKALLSTPTMDYPLTPPTTGQPRSMTMELKGHEKMCAIGELCDAALEASERLSGLDVSLTLGASARRLREAVKAVQALPVEVSKAKAGDLVAGIDPGDMDTQASVVPVPPKRVMVMASDYAYVGFLVGEVIKLSGEVRTVVEDVNGRLFIHRPDQVQELTASAKASEAQAKRPYVRPELRSAGVLDRSWLRG